MTRGTSRFLFKRNGGHVTFVVLEHGRFHGTAGYDKNRRLKVKFYPIKKKRNSCMRSICKIKLFV
jgi:hypothetical protein